MQVYNEKLEKVLAKTGTGEDAGPNAIPIDASPRKTSESVKIGEGTASGSHSKLSVQRSGARKTKKRVKCDECELKFTRESDAVRHRNTVHTRKEHKCTTCQKSYTRADALQRHMSKKDH